MSLGVPRASVYKGSRGRGAGRPRGGAPGGVLLLPGVGLPPFLVGLGFRRRGKEERERKERGAPLRPPPPPCPILTATGGLPWRLSSLSTKAHGGPLVPPGVPVIPSALRFYPNLSETIPVSKHNLPIYQYLCLDHFKTPRHVCDLIRDSEQTSVIKNT